MRNRHRGHRIWPKLPPCHCRAGHACIVGPSVFHYSMARGGETLVAYWRTPVGLRNAVHSGCHLSDKQALAKPDVESWIATSKRAAFALGRLACGENGNQFLGSDDLFISDFLRECGSTISGSKLRELVPISRFVWGAKMLCSRGGPALGSNSRNLLRVVRNRARMNQHSVFASDRSSRIIMNRR